MCHTWSVDLNTTLLERTSMPSHAQDECSADEPLIFRAKSGDVSAFEEIYRRHVHRAYALILRITGNCSLAEEVTQDAFVAAWRNLADYRGDCAFSSWLYRIAVNTAVGALRARRRRETWMNALRWLRGSSTPSRTPSPEVQIDLDTAIAQLPQGARTVFVLHDVEGYKHEEVAEMLGISPGTCKAHLHSARMKLRKELNR